MKVVVRVAIALVLVIKTSMRVGVILDLALMMMSIMDKMVKMKMMKILMVKMIRPKTTLKRITL